MNSKPKMMSQDEALAILRANAARQTAGLAAAIAEAKSFPEMLSVNDIDLLDNIAAMIRKGESPSQRQGWAVTAIRNRVMRSEQRQPTKATPTSAPTAAPLLPARRPIILSAKTPTGVKLVNLIAVYSKRVDGGHRDNMRFPGERFPTGHAVDSKIHGHGVVVRSDDQESVVAFRHSENVVFNSDLASAKSSLNSEGAA